MTCHQLFISTLIFFLFFGYQKWWNSDAGHLRTLSKKQIFLLYLPIFECSKDLTRGISCSSKLWRCSTIQSTNEFDFYVQLPLINPTTSQVLFSLKRESITLQNQLPQCHNVTFYSVEKKMRSEAMNTLCHIGSDCYSFLLWFNSCSPSQCRLGTYCFLWGHIIVLLGSRVKRVCSGLWLQIDTVWNSLRSTNID